MAPGSLTPLTGDPFLAGLLSACSMPLGAAAAMGWTPGHRMQAVLMAFGAGALLSALVINLVATIEARGHLLELVLGSIAGSLLFTVVNRTVNASGGFLRKPSTVLGHLAIDRSRQRRRRLRLLAATPFRGRLAAADLAAVAERLYPVDQPGGTALFQRGDPGESVYLIVRGRVSLVDPEALGEEPGRMGPGHCVGLMAFLTGSPHHGAAVTAGACDLLVFSRPDFEDLLQTSSSFAAAVGRWIESEPVARYLGRCHRFDDARRRDWVNRALAELTTRRRLPDAVPVDRGREAFLAMARLVGKFPVFRGLPEADLEEIADRLLHRTFADGEAFFQAGERADRLFILQEGDVGLLDPSRPSQPPRPILPGQAFGELSFVTGARHSVTAVARTEVRAWVLRKLDFEEMLRRSPELEEAVRGFLARPLVSAYLEHRQGFAAEKAGRWVASALRSMNGNHLLPSLTGVIEGLEDQPSAPVAIWVGLLMDGIPEALAIGAQMILVPLSPSFLAGLFISNFPEALSSSSGMREQGFPRSLIMLLWSGLAIAIGLLALAGSVLFAGAPERSVSLVKATAAGAMLTVISETMLPESSARGGSVVGLSTILGFLTIILIDHHA